MDDGDATVTVRVTLPVLEGSGGATDDALVGAELRRLWVIEQVRLLEKRGGKSGDWRAAPPT